MPRERTPGATLMGPNDLRTNRPRMAGAAPSREQSGTPGGGPGAVLRLPQSGEHNRYPERESTTAPMKRAIRITRHPTMAVTATLGAVAILLLVHFGTGSRGRRHGLK